MEFPEWVKPGAVYRLNYPGDNLYNKIRYEVRAFVDDRAIVRYWSKSRRFWCYEAREVEYYHYRKDFIKVLKKGK